MGCTFRNSYRGLMLDSGLLSRLEYFGRSFHMLVNIVFRLIVLNYTSVPILLLRVSMYLEIMETSHSSFINYIIESVSGQFHQSQKDASCIIQAINCYTVMVDGIIYAF